MEIIVGIIVVFVLYKMFSGKGAASGGSKGDVLKPWTTKYKCDGCGHDRFVNIEYIDRERYDSVWADCAKCGKNLREDGPFNPPYRR